MEAAMPAQPNPPLIFAAASSAAMNQFAAAKSEWSKRLLRRAAGPATGGVIPGAITAGAVRRLSGTVSPRPEHNVVGVGVGEKIVDGRPTGEAAVKFFVRV